MVGGGRGVFGLGPRRWGSGGGRRARGQALALPREPQLAEAAAGLVGRAALAPRGSQAGRVRTHADARGRVAHGDDAGYRRRGRIGGRVAGGGGHDGGGAQREAGAAARRGHAVPAEVAAEPAAGAARIAPASGGAGRAALVVVHAESEPEVPRAGVACDVDTVGRLDGAGEERAIGGKIATDAQPRRAQERVSRASHYSGDV